MSITMEMELSKQHIKQLEPFKEIIWEYYAAFGRRFSWRETTEPYHIVVSEVMLQQTQTHRVKGKFEQFIDKFPTFNHLAQASLHEVIAAWQGLGYNRRGLYLQQIAQKVINEYNSILPDDPAILINFPGIGTNTAASICAFAYNKPMVFIETNIRTVFIHFFFMNESVVRDNQLMPLIEATVDQKDARHWYYALMDYGVMLKSKFPNPSRKSAHHVRQSKFEGSDRQIRGLILKHLTDRTRLTFNELTGLIDRDEERIANMLLALEKEGLIKNSSDFFSIN